MRKLLRLLLTVVTCLYVISSPYPVKCELDTFQVRIEGKAQLENQESPMGIIVQVKRLLVYREYTGLINEIPLTVKTETNEEGLFNLVFDIEKIKSVLGFKKYGASVAEGLAATYSFYAELEYSKEGYIDYNKFSRVSTFRKHPLINELRINWTKEVILMKDSEQNRKRYNFCKELSVHEYTKHLKEYMERFEKEKQDLSQEGPETLTSKEKEIEKFIAEISREHTYGRIDYMENYNLISFATLTGDAKNLIDSIIAIEEKLIQKKEDNRVLADRIQAYFHLNAIVHSESLHIRTRDMMISFVDRFPKDAHVQDFMLDIVKLSTFKKSPAESYRLDSKEFVEKFMKLFPDSHRIPEMLYESWLFDELIDKYPDSEFTPFAIYQNVYLGQNKPNDMHAWRNDFVEKYPNSTMSARVMWETFKELRQEWESPYTDDERKKIKDRYDPILQKIIKGYPDSTYADDAFFYLIDFPQAYHEVPIIGYYDDKGGKLNYWKTVDESSFQFSQKFPKSKLNDYILFLKAENLCNWRKKFYEGASIYLEISEKYPEGEFETGLLSAGFGINPNQKLLVFGPYGNCYNYLTKQQKDELKFHLINKIHQQDENIGLKMLLGESYENEGDYPQAVSVYKEITDENHVSFLALLHLALCYEKMGNIKSAIGAYSHLSLHTNAYEGQYAERLEKLFKGKQE